MLGRFIAVSGALCVTIMLMAAADIDPPEPHSEHARVAPQPATATHQTTHKRKVRGRTFYVRSSGSDERPGNSVANAWRTVSRVNAAAFKPGDRVLFEGGSTFADETLRPSRSGRRNRPVSYGSYGGPPALLPGGIMLEDVSWIVIRGFVVRGGRGGVFGSADGSGASHVTIEHNVFDRLVVGIYSANPASTAWEIRDNRISHTGDSGMILYGSDFLISGNSIIDTGRDRSITYGKHGIYLKVIGARVTANTIRRFQGNGVSVRYRNSIVDNNVIADGPAGIAWFQYDRSPGTSNWHHNTISGTTAAGIYVSPSDHGRTTRESFVISDNTLSKNSGVYTDLKPTTGTYTVSGNRRN